MVRLELSQLNLQAKLGDQFQLYFNKLASGKFLAEERINGKVCFLDRNSGPIRSGDRCLVWLRNMSPKGDIYYACLIKVTEPGDGKNTVLKRAIEVSRPTFVKCPYYVRAGMRKARSYFKHRHLDLLKFHLRFIDRLKLEQSLYDVQIDYAPVMEDTIELIERCFVHDSAQAVEWLVELATCLPAGKCESKLASTTFALALQRALQKATFKELFVLESYLGFVEKRLAAASQDDEFFVDRDFFEAAQARLAILKN